MKLDITPGQCLYWRGECAVVRRVQEGGREIVIQSATGEVPTVTPAELWRENPDLVVIEEESDVDWKKAYMKAVAAKTYTGDDSEEDLYWQLMEVEELLTGDLEQDVALLRDRMGY